MSRFLTCILMLIGSGLIGQSLQDWMDLGDEAMADNDPYGALRYYSNGMALDSAKGSLIYRLAEAYRGVQNYPKAVYYYDKIYRRDRGMVFSGVGMKLAEMQMQSGEYAEAKLNWRRVRKDHQKSPNSYAHQKAVQSVRSCDLAQKWSKEPKPFDLTEAGDPVNSGDSEFGGIWKDDGGLSFTSLRGSYDDLSRLETEAYFIKVYEADSLLENVRPGEIGSIDLTNNYGNYVTSTSGRKALVMIDQDGRRSIHLNEGLKWLRIFPQDDLDTSNYSHPAFGRMGDVDVLFFASDRPDGFGQYDLWYTELPDGGDAINLGTVINSPGNEVTPFFRKDDQTLYFSSDWHHGFGGYDIFKSPYFEGAFGFPENLKSPFSTPSNDLYYSFSPVLKKGSVTSNRVGPDDFGGCCNNLFLFEEKAIAEADTLPEITSLEELNDYLPVTLYFHNDEPDPKTTRTETERNYLSTYRDYVKLLPAYRNEYRKGLDENTGDQAEDAMDDFFLREIDQGVADLELFSKLLQRELEEGAQIEITVKGFASPLAATAYNVNLTERRISSLENYLGDYERGVLRPYLSEASENGGILRLSKIPFGEYTAEEMVSDNPNESNAVYSIAAAKERKIEIVSVTRAVQDSALAEVRFTAEIIDLGTVSPNSEIRFKFNFEVLGEARFVIDSISDNPGLNLSHEAVYENGHHSMQGTLSTAGYTGKQNIVTTVFGNLPGREKELNLTFEVE